MLLALELSAVGADCLAVRSRRWPPGMATGWCDTCLTGSTGRSASSNSTSTRWSSSTHGTQNRPAGLPGRGSPGRAHTRRGHAAPLGGGASSACTNDSSWPSTTLVDIASFRANSAPPGRPGQSRSVIVVPEPTSSRG